MLAVRALERKATFQPAPNRIWQRRRRPEFVDSIQALARADRCFPAAGPERVRNL
jgi:hypothetical protein